MNRESRNKNNNTLDRGSPGSEFWRSASRGRSPSPKFTTGFTLIEALVAISIVTVVVAAVMSAVQTSIRSGVIAEDRITAFFLAQEATEYVKNEIANNIIAGDHWLDGMGDCIGPNSWCTMDVYEAPESGGVEKCTGNGPEDCDFVKNDNGRYGHDSGWSDTRFTRSVHLERFRTTTNNAACNVSSQPECRAVRAIVEVAWWGVNQEEKFKIVINGYAYHWRDN